MAIHNSVKICSVCLDLSEEIRASSITSCDPSVTYHNEDVINSLRRRGSTKNVRVYRQSSRTVRHSPSKTRSIISGGHVGLYTL
ncbi:hypothetical protein ACS0PU_012378 [Formica fusca]